MKSDVMSKKKIKTIEVPDELIRVINAYASIKGMAQKELVKQIIRQWVAANCDELYQLIIKEIANEK